jgi:hypothetical protein
MTHQVIVIREVQGSVQRLLTNYIIFEHHERANFLDYGYRCSNLLLGVNNHIY